MWVPVCGGHILLEAGSREQNINGKHPPPFPWKGETLENLLMGPLGSYFVDWLCRLRFAVKGIPPRDGNV